jgi:hypothetical protein
MFRHQRDAPDPRAARDFEHTRDDFKFRPPRRSRPRLRFANS